MKRWVVQCCVLGKGRILALSYTVFCAKKEEKLSGEL